ncbi:MAG: hypothetical protein WAM14_16310 [Candidatus Nitrosopolaris sp.]
MKAKISGKRPITASKEDGEDNSFAALKNALDYSLDILKVNEETEVGRRIVELAVKRLPQNWSSEGKWLTVTKTIADICAENDRHIFSQSGLYDFLTLATKQMDEKHGNVFTSREIVFKIYRDIMENYQSANKSLKANYPKIIVDMVSVLMNGRDTIGRDVSTHSIERYYQTRKSEILPIKKDSNKPIDTLEKDYDLIESLGQITGRERPDLIASLSKLDSEDVGKLTDLCLNYNKLRKYSRLISSEENFKKEIENELGRKLTNNQLQHASVSIRKSRTYIENVLDGKFVPHGSHGINHVRHNLEYGYQLMGFIERKKRGSQKSH